MLGIVPQYNTLESIFVRHCWIKINHESPWLVCKRMDFALLHSFEAFLHLPWTVINWMMQKFWPSIVCLQSHELILHEQGWTHQATQYYSILPPLLSYLWASLDSLLWQHCHLYCDACPSILMTWDISPCSHPNPFLRTCCHHSSHYFPSYQCLDCNDS